jgi:hypothetical protein
VTEQRHCETRMLCCFAGPLSWQAPAPQIDWGKEQHMGQLTTSNAVLALGLISSAEICHMWRVGVRNRLGYLSTARVDASNKRPKGEHRRLRTERAVGYLVPQPPSSPPFRKTANTLSSAEQHLAFPSSTTRIGSRSTPARKFFSEPASYPPLRLTSWQVAAAIEYLTGYPRFPHR